MSSKFCRCGPPPANCARKIAGPLIVFTLAPSTPRLLLNGYPDGSDFELRKVVAADLHRLQDGTRERLFLLIEVRLGAIGLGGADDLLPVDHAFAQRHGRWVL